MWKKNGRVTPVFGVVVMMLFCVTGVEVTTRVVCVGSTVSSEGTYKRKIFCLLYRQWECLCVLIHVLCVCVRDTWLKGDLAEHHPDVSEVKAAAEWFGGAAIQRHGDVASTWVPVVQHCLECHRLRLPASNEAGLKPTGDGGEDLDAAGEHVVTVNLDIGTQECLIIFDRLKVK